MATALWQDISHEEEIIADNGGSEYEALSHGLRRSVAVNTPTPTPTPMPTPSKSQYTTNGDYPDRPESMETEPFTNALNGEHLSLKTEPEITPKKVPPQDIQNLPHVAIHQVYHQDANASRGSIPVTVHSGVNTMTMEQLQPHTGEGTIHSGKRRKLLRDWLREHLDRATFPGVEWIDRERATFKVPWLHNAKRGWRQADGLVFRAWSQYTTTYKSKDTFATLKTRFRCALTKASDIEYMIHLSSKDDENCFRAYRFKSEAELREKRQNRGHRSQPESMATIGATPYQHQYGSESVPCSATLENEGRTYITLADGQLLYFEQMSHVPVEFEDGEGSAPGQIMDTGTSVAMVTTQEEASPQKENDPVVIKERSRDRKDDDYFTLELSYEGKAVAQGPFRKGLKCSLLFEKEMKEKSKNLMYMPKWDCNKYSENPAKVDTFFSNMGGGLDIELDDHGDLYATRNCLVRVFYSSFLKFHQSPHLERGKRKRIFCLKEFEESLDTLDDESRKTCSAEIYVGFGKPWLFRDGNDKKPFVSAKIKSSEAEEKSNHKLMDDDATYKMSSLLISGPTSNQP